MKGWRDAFDRIGGPDAVTWPAFWVTYIASLVGHLTSGGAVAASLGTRLVVITIVQLATFVPLVVLRYTLLRNPPRPRPWVAIAGFATAAVVRGVGLGWILVAIGAADTPSYPYRITASLVTICVVLIVVAVVVSTMRMQTRVLGTLLRIQSELSQTQERLLTEVEERNEETLARVKARLAEEMTALDSTDGAGSVVELQRLASDVVRPLSHELAASVRIEKPEETGIDDVHVTREQVVAQMTGTAPFRPALTGLMMTVVMAVAALGAYGSLGIPMLVVTVSVVVIASWLANRILGYVLPRLGSSARFVVVILSAFMIGYVASASAAWVLRSTDMAETMFLAGGIYISVVVLLLAVVSAVMRQQNAAERDLMEYGERLRWSVVRLRQLQWVQQKALSRALHGPVQAAVTSGALRLEAAVRAGEPTDDLVERIRIDLRSVIDVLDVPQADGPDIDLAIARLVGTWTGLCDMDFHIDADAWQLVADDQVAAAVVIDLMTEAVSNAVRHGGATRIVMTLSLLPGDRLELSVRDNGHEDVGQAKWSGLGTSLLDECALEWARSATPAGSELVAILPG